jgi:uncharacterized protein YggE
MSVVSRVAVAAAAAVLVAGAGSAQEAGREGPPQIVTSGQGEVRVTPDRATVSIGVQSRAATAAEASSANGRKQRAVIDAIRAKGVAADQITTTGFSVQPEVKYDRPGSPPVTTGYLVANTVTVQLSRTDLAGAVIDASIAAGANQIHGLSFSISNPDSARRAALAIAVGRAKGDADAAARAAGGTLGTLIELTATEHEVPMFRVAASMSRMEAAADTPVEAGLQPVRASVMVRWQFLPGR